MLAFGLSILLFIFWCVIGYSVLALLHKQDNLLQNILLAPVVGVATTLLLIFWLSRADIPVAYFGKALAIALMLTSIGLLWRFRPKFPCHDYLPFVGIFLVALFLTGRPMLEFGFDWASYANQDMTYYSLSAHRYLNHGYFDPPNADFASGLDYTFGYWFLQMRGHRTGSELLLAWIVSLTGLMAPQVYMSVILAFHLVLISTTGALVYQSSLFRLAAMLTCGLLSLSALTSLGTLYQLLAQVSGVGLLTGCATLLLRPFKELKIKDAIRHSILVSILVSGLLIVYSEVFPFLVLTFLLYMLVGLIQQRLTLRPIFPVLGTVFLVTILTLNTYLLDVIRFSQSTSTRVLKSANLQDIIFPFYLIPSGLASFWGMQSVAQPSPEPWVSISITIGGLLLLTVSIATLLLIRSGQPTVIITAVMLSVGLLLFIYKNDFGLFKLAMFIQPFLIGTLVTAWVGMARRRIVQILPLVLIGLINLHTQFSYVETSGDFSSGSLVEIPNASTSRIYTELKQLISSTASQNLLLNTSNPSLVGLQALYTKGKVAAFTNLFGFLIKQDVFLNFNLHDRYNQAAQNEFIKENVTLEQSVISSSDALLITTTPHQGLFNRWHFNPAISNNFAVYPLSKVNNQLMFIRSLLGKHYFAVGIFGSSSQASFYQLEPDFFLPGRTIAGIGRHFLFQVLNPSIGGRLVLNMTTSLKNDGENQLPPADAIGTERQSFPMIGRGSARVFSPPLSPQVITGRTYLSVDMGVDGQTFLNRKTGLMKLYGEDIATDQRRLVGYARDISLVSNKEYAKLAPPSNLSTFPADLTNPNLEYSGLYEDGWVSEAAFFGLTQPNASSQLTVRGMIPKINDPTFISELRVLVNDQEVAKQILKPGKFDIKVKVPQGNKRRIDLRFSKFQRLQAPDNRPVAAKLKFIGFADGNN